MSAFLYLTKIVVRLVLTSTYDDWLRVGWVPKNAKCACFVCAHWFEDTGRTAPRGSVSLHNKKGLCVSFFLGEAMGRELRTKTKLELSLPISGLRWLPHCLPGLRGCSNRTLYCRRNQDLSNLARKSFCLFHRQAIDIWCLNIRISVTAQGPSTVVVGHDKYNVLLFSFYYRCPTGVNKV